MSARGENAMEKKVIEAIEREKLIVILENHNSGC